MPGVPCPDPHAARATEKGSPDTRSDEWGAYGRDGLGTRYSPLDEISVENVSTLELAWKYSTGESEVERPGPRQPAQFEATPIVVEKSMYLSTPLGRVIALDPESGLSRWVYDPQIDRSPRGRAFSLTNRGVSTWLDPHAPLAAPCRRRLFVGTADARLIALDARDGRPCAGFGFEGSVDLRVGLRNPPNPTEYGVTSPPAVLRDMVVVGSSISDDRRAEAASGEVRAFDTRTGALRWSWDPIPQSADDPGWRSWIGPRAHRAGAANAWSVIAVDAERDLVVVPTSSPSTDHYGGERRGTNLYANSVVALRGSTGRPVWHFQVVHHDLWDYDVASPPALVNLRREGREVPAVLQATKSGQLFVLHRETGAPIFPVAEKAVPASDVPGEEAWPTQPFNTVLPSLSPTRVDASEAWGPTPADRDACREQMRGLRNDGIFTPPSLTGTLFFPANFGGAHWGGLAYDPERSIVVIPTNRVPAAIRLFPRDADDDRLRGEPGYQAAVGHPLRSPSILAALSLRASLHRPPLRDARGPQPGKRPEALGGSLGFDGGAAGVGEPQPGWPHRDRGGPRLHRREHGRAHSCFRRPDGARAVEAPPPCGGQGHAHDLPARTGESAARRDRGRRRRAVE